MRPRYSFSSRRTGHLKNISRQRQKYPEITEKILSDSDIIVEVIDARFINETQNSEIEDSIKERGGKIIRVINKIDLVNKEDLGRASNKQHFDILQRKKRHKRIKEYNKNNSFTIKKEKVVVGVLGYPNTGKSSLINILIGKSSAPTSSQSGFTKGVQKLKLKKGIVILDSPGVIPKKEYSNIEKKKIAKHTKIGSRTYSHVKDPETIIFELMKWNPGLIEKYYEIDAEGNVETLIEELGKQKDMFKKGGVVDSDRVSRLILKEWQEGKIRRY